MKKIATLLIAAVLCFGVAGCEKAEQKKEAKYIEGTYTAEIEDDYNNEGNIASAKVVVDKDGKIESIYLDTTYKTKDGKETTKKALGNDYNMKTYNPSAAGEWFEQVEKLENAIVENQGVDFIELKEDDTTDAVSGCTIKVNALVAAAEKAISDARNPKAE